MNTRLIRRLMLASAVVFSVFLCANGDAAMLYGGLRYYANDKTPLEVLTQRAKKRFNVASEEAILVIGQRRERSAIPMLEDIVANPSPPKAILSKYPRNYEQVLIKGYRDSSLAAKMALARMGVGNYFDEFVAGLSSTSVDWREDCGNALGYIGDKRAVKYLGPMLNQKEAPPKGPSHMNRSNASIAEDALFDLMPEKYAAEKARRNNSPPPTEFWERWWEQNRAKYK